jgi:kynurenine formamidase
MEFQDVASLDRDGYYLRRFSMGEHSATHMNAPIAFHPDGVGIDAYPPASLTVPAVVIDVTAGCGNDPDYQLSIAEVADWEHRHGRVPNGSVVLLHTGWQEKWHDPLSYLGTRPNDDLRFPGFGQDAATFLIDQRAVAGLGTDTPGLEPGSDRGFGVNKLLLEQPRIALENLTNLDQLPPTGITLVIGILRLQGGSGSPASVTAFVE